MRNNRRGGRRPRKKYGRGFSLSKRTLLIICAAAAALAIILIAVSVGGNKTDDPSDVLNGNDVFAENIYIEGVCVGGMNAAEARNALGPVVNGMDMSMTVKLEVPFEAPVADGEQQASEEDGEEGEESADSEQAEEQATVSATGTKTEYMGGGKGLVKYAASDIGVYVDVEGALTEAMEFSNSQGRVNDETPKKDFALKYALDEQACTSRITTDSAAWGTPAKNASYTLETVNNKEALTTTAALIKEEGANGSNVDIAGVVSQIKNMTASGQFSKIVAPVVETVPEIMLEDLDNIEVIGEYSTEFTGSEGRMYNIWMISSILNGTEIDAEDTMSVNDIVGPRTDPNVWKPAPGIENGVFTDQLGGGICQVSSTLYIAALKAEMKIEERVHHTIPSTYVPLGLDATISTEWPDLVLTNNTEFPMLIGIDCDVKGRTVDVKIYGVKPRDYTLRFESKVIETIPAPADEYIANSEVEEGVLKPLGSAREGNIVEVYKIWYDKQTKEETDRKRIYTDTYKAIPAKYEYNPNTPPEMILSGSIVHGAGAPATPTSPETSSDNSSSTPDTGGSGSEGSGGGE